MLEIIELSMTGVSLCLSSHIQFSKEGMSIYHQVAINDLIPAPTMEIMAVNEAWRCFKLHNVHIAMIDDRI